MIFVVRATQHLRSLPPRLPCASTTTINGLFAVG